MEVRLNLYINLYVMPSSSVIVICHLIPVLPIHRYWEKNLTERQATTCDIELTMPATPAGKTVYVKKSLV